MVTVLCFVLLFVLLLWGAISPESQWKALAAWQYRNPEANEPSDTVYTLMRVGSVVALAALACGGLILVVDRPKTGSGSPAPAESFNPDLLVRPNAIRAAFDADDADLIIVPELVSAPKRDQPVKVLRRQAVDDTATPDWLTGGNHLTVGTRLVVAVGHDASPSALVVQEDADRVKVTVYTDCATCPTAPPASPDPGARVRVYLIPVSLHAPLGTRQVVDGSTGATVA